MGVEVGDHADRVRQPDTVGEGAAALVVDEYERHFIRPVHDGERRNDRLQQLGLAGSGGAGDQPVRAVPAEVQRERAVEREAHWEGGATRADKPASGHRGRGWWLQADHVQEPGCARDGRLVVPADIADRCQGAGEPCTPGRGPASRHHGVGIGGQRGRDEIRADVTDDLGMHLHQAQPGAGFLGHGLTLLRQVPGVVVQTDRVDAQRGSVPQD